MQKFTRGIWDVAEETVEAIENQGREKEFTEIVSERIVSIRKSINNPDTEPTLIHLLEETEKLNLCIFQELTGEEYDKRFS